MRVLFITWDGPGTRYLESLFLPIFAELQSGGIEVHVVQFGWGDTREVRAAATAATRAGIRYVFRPIWKGMPASGAAAAITTGAAWIARYVHAAAIDVLMPRSIIPAGMALLARTLCPQVRLVFDADGLMADERVDFGGWSADDARYRVLRAVERLAVRRADVVLVRTRRAAAILRRRARPERGVTFAVVANGKDPDVYRPGSARERDELRSSLGIERSAPVLVYSGSLGPQYHPERMLAFFAGVHRRLPDARLLVLSSMPIDERWWLAAGSAREAVHLLRVDPGAVGAYLAAADVGLAFREPCVSQEAVAPIKVGEYLLCGVPVIAPAGIGDLDGQISESIGHLTPTLGDGDLRRASDWFVASVLPDREGYRERCRRAGIALFGLSRAVQQYHDALALAVSTAPDPAGRVPATGVPQSGNVF